MPQGFLQSQTMIYVFGFQDFEFSVPFFLPV